MTGGMKVTHVVENLARGGLERMVVDLARTQRASGWDVQVACLFDRGLLADELEADGVPVHACGKRGGADIGALLRLRERLRARQHGVLHTHNAAAHYHAVVACGGLRFARTINTRHSMSRLGPRSRAEWLYRRSLHRTDAVATVCEAARRGFSEQGVRPRGALLAVPNGIRVDAFDTASAARRQALARALDLGPDARIVGTVGRCVPVKDQASLLRAFARVLSQEPCAALVVVGDGPSRPRLEALAGSLGVAARTRFLGDRSDVPALLPGFEVFALSSRSEGYSLALLEACAAGLPIVATDVGGNGEIVAAGHNGLLVRAGDPAAFAAALLELLGDAAAAVSMGRHGRAWAEGEASLQAMETRYARLYGMAT